MDDLDIFVSTPTLAGLVENDWINRTIDVGDEAATDQPPCARCVMTTLA